MAGEKNFNVKNGLSVGGVEVINSSGDLVAGGVGTAVNEAIADKIGGIISATGGATATYNDGADTIVIDVPITDEDNMASNSATALASQQSIKAYVDAVTTSLNAQDLDIASDSGSIDVDLDTESFTIAGGAGIDTSATGTTLTIAGELATETNAGIATFDGTDFTVSSGDVTVNAERVQDIVGAMVSSNTESGVTVAYQDGDGTLDFTVGTLNQSTTGSAATLTTARTLAFTGDVTGTGSFDGSANLSTALTIAANSVALGTDTTGNYVGTITGGTGVTSSAATSGEGTTHSLSIGQDIATSAKPSFAGVTTTAASTIGGHILPTTDDTYDLGSASKQWRDVFVGPGSLYVNGQKVVEDDSGTITISADSNQNVKVSTSGSGDVELDPTGTGQIELKGPVQVTAGSNISSSDGNAISFSNSIDVDALESRSTDTNLTLTANGTGVVALNDNVTIAGTLTVSGTTTTVNSETINLADNIIVLNSNFTSGSPSEDTGFSVLRGGSATKSFIWDESEDEWSVGSEKIVAGTFEGNLVGNVTGNVTGNTSGSSGSTTGNAATATILASARTIGGVSFNGSANINLPGVNASGTQNTSGTAAGLSGSPNISVGTIASGAITITNATNAGGTARNIHQSTSAPTGGAGAVGDLWVLYS
jgi:hypothetical protein